MLEKLYLRNLRYPESQEIRPILTFLCNSLGITDSDSIKLFITLFVKSKYGKGVTLQELSGELNLNMKKTSQILDEFMDLGWIRNSRDKFMLRENSLAMTLDSVLDDIFMISRNLKRACVIVDRKATKNAVDKIIEEW
ncbi:hypothetical protein COT72_01090 [archaeon CG10_big_fil_rev_8_21_14_0_10_43_11]|nr:MAG: hypothetical protein COT72_01090 [archaeon CG10_big_fil_rev_8_21_14_0_10_43_11]